MLDDVVAAIFAMIVLAAAASVYSSV